MGLACSFLNSKQRCLAAITLISTFICGLHEPCIGKAAPGTVANRVAVVPMTYHPLLCPLPIIYARINTSSEALPFIVDLGTANPLILDLRVADKLRIDRKAGIPAGQSRGANAVQVKVDSVELCVKNGSQAISFANVPTTIAKLEMAGDNFCGPRVAGIIGWYAFKSVSARFDFRSLELEIYPDRDAPKGSVKEFELPLTVDNLSLLLPVRTQPKDSPTDMILDTGAVYTHVPQKLVSRFEVLAQLGEKISTYTLSGTTEANPILINSLGLGPNTVQPVYALTSGDIKVPLLGMDVLKRFTITVDIDGGHIWFEPDGTATFDTFPGRSSISLARNKSGLIVDSIEPDSSACKSGIARGDQVLECDGKALKELTRAAAMNLINGLSGKEAQLEVLRGKERLTIRWDREPAFVDRTAPSVGIGADIGRSADGRWIVADVGAGTPAKLSGLNVGDEILRIDDSSIPGIDPEKFNKLLKRQAYVPIRMRVKSIDGRSERDLVLIPRAVK